MQQVILAAVGVYALIIISLFVLQRNLMYHTDTALIPISQTQIPDAEIHHVESEPGVTLQSWYLPPSAGKPVIVFFQGNAGTIADRDHKAALWNKAGYGVWLAGYRGFGGNQGSPTEQGLYTDARAAIGALREIGFAPEQIVLYGESLGTGIATQMAHELAAKDTPAHALVLEAPFSSMGAAAQSRYPFVPARWLVKDRYDSITKIAAISAPLFIIHGDQDGVIPQAHGRTLFETASEPKQSMWIDGAGHTDLFDYGAGEAVMAFLDKLG